MSTRAQLTNAVCQHVISDPSGPERFSGFTREAGSPTVCDPDNILPGPDDLRPRDGYAK